MEGSLINELNGSAGMQVFSIPHYVPFRYILRGFDSSPEDGMTLDTLVGFRRPVVNERFTCSLPVLSAVAIFNRSPLEPLRSFSVSCGRLWFSDHERPAWPLADAQN